MKSEYMTIYGRYRKAAGLTFYYHLGLHYSQTWAMC